MVETNGARERRWDVDGLRIAGLEWGSEEGLPVLALHGWMDHAASFAELAPRLNGCHVVALDLSGQGLSGHRAAHASYNIWDDLPQILRVLDALGWEECVLLGHSRGANIAALLAAAMPERVRGFIALDSLAPEPVAQDFVTTLRAYLTEVPTQAARPPRSFPTREAYIARRAGQGNARAVAEALAKRALEEGSEGWHLRGDRRLFASSAAKLDRDDVEAVLRAIRAPVLNIWAADGIRARREGTAELARWGAELIADYESVEIAGDHHFHLDPDAAEQIAKAMTEWRARKL
ncbi:alpha/beta hydrolase [Thioclava sp. NG1]|uniref:alpha/beta fold hydrolase n=1 Tax=Thioclava sp. NG1 TaxID=2182426 RepID=UPI000D6062AD|nr:alpha/beta fold hydrolase [Thioclava sp. NG1]PWE51922.1 alpha/beta hydrolase [Thioclava sp. NG1]